MAVADGFEKNSSGHRAYRVGIDASIWFKHSTFSKGGENHELRTLFFKIIYLLKMPILPLIVFDGRHRPKEKRGSRMGKSGSHNLSRPFKELLDAFGVEWREAPGEAEAELGHLNNLGIIDAIMSDDCDSFIFGAKVVIKNKSKELSGNASNPAVNAAGKVDKHHTMVYRIEDIQNDPDIGLKRGGLVLFALLCGGDYDQKGVRNIGKVAALALARCGFGEKLLAAYQTKSPAEFQRFLHQWRSEVNTELMTNSRGFLSRRMQNASLPPDFPALTTLEKYANPKISSNGGSGPVTSGMRDRGDVDLAALAAFCEKYFEWATKDGILEKFRNNVWPVAAMHVLRRSALAADRKARAGGCGAPIGTPPSLIIAHLGQKKKHRDTRLDALDDVFHHRAPHQSQPTEYRPNEPDPNPLFSQITNARVHAETDGLLEYKVEICPTQLVNLTLAGVKGTRAEPESNRTRPPKPPAPPHSKHAFLVCGTVLAAVHPQLVEEYKEKQRNKAKKKPGRRRKEPGGQTSDFDDGIIDRPPEASTSVSAFPEANTSGKSNSAEKGNRQHPSLTQVRADDLRFDPDPPNRRTGFLATFRDPGLNGDEDEQSDDEMEPFADKESPADDELAQSPRLAAIWDQILDNPVRLCAKSKGKRKATDSPVRRQEKRQRSVGALSQPRHRTSPPVVTSGQTHSRPKVSQSSSRRREDSDSEIEVTSPRPIPSFKDAGRVSRRESPAPMPPSSQYSIYGGELPELSDSDEEGLFSQIPLASASSRMNTGHPPRRQVLDEVIDLT
ncbi:hypothetical protein CC1G_07381 [Coprinopsis cinerea okayama7|uniref:XPG-I domain-containing protein n=1 Tax=Coprinopsis cinerea (strain Okayama-7 / 130 / ATCC MYA-4618 / FGSC 9003) TaxID=240176 RepID=A8N6L0_COPC7|nr:hypothetical protein CC1G_07381 [Coprinopsis cinerea okayama7\|eukprot:XP_001830466.2 hypothetical protein CC1G_07381 [Coprinopsis cinerea okayama7\